MPSSLFLGICSLLIFTVSAVPNTFAARSSGPTYELADQLTPANFFDAFNFKTSEEFIDDPVYSTVDPTRGFVRYLSKEDALAFPAGPLISTTSKVATMKVDTTNTYVPGVDFGRPSIRIEGKKSYTHGLFIADIAHMPGPACGVWPAFWTLGSGLWPNNGEIDIIEQLGLATNNQMHLHTSNQCSVVTGLAANPVYDPVSLATGSGDCSVSHSKTGCGVDGSGASNYGADFNKNNGGVYIMQWTSDFIKIWFFSHGGSLPSTLSDAVPDVSQFGTPQAAFLGGSGCDIDSHFKEHRIVFDTTFCGDWAGLGYPTDGTCPLVSGATPVRSCTTYVGNNPSAFTEAYWSINGIRVFTEKTGNSASSASSSPSTSLSKSSGSQTTSSALSVQTSTAPSSPTYSVGIFVEIADSSTTGTTKVGSSTSTSPPAASSTSKSSASSLFPSQSALAMFLVLIANVIILAL